MDPNGTWRAGNSSRPHLMQTQMEDNQNSSDAESSQQGWSGTEWNANTNPRPSISSSDDQLPSPIPTHPPYTSSEPYASPSGIPHRRPTIVKSSIHTSGSNVSLNGLNPSEHQFNGAGPGSGSAILDINTTSSPSTSSSGRLLPSPLSNTNGYSQAGPSNHNATSSAYASTSYARSRRKETEVEVIESDGDNDNDENDSNRRSSSPSHLGKLKMKKRIRGNSFTLPFHRNKRKLSTSLPWPTRWWPGGGGNSNNSGYSKSQQRPKSTLRSILTVLLLIGSLVWGISIWRKRYEIQVEFSIFSKKWIKNEIDSISTLKGCFSNPSPYYNMSKHLAPKRNMLSPGISLKRGMSCYDFSSTIQPSPEQPVEELIYHTYWRSDLIEFGDRQTKTFESFLATQPLQYSKLILWTNGKQTLEQNEYIKPYLIKWGEYIEVKQVDMNLLTRGTDLQHLLSPSSNVGGGKVFDQKGWVDGDAIRLLVLWHHGGIWLDMDQILLRDLHPLTEEEWVTQWDCYDKPYFSLNGALMHFEKHSPYLCEAFHIMSTSPFPKPNTFTWGSHLYSKLHRALLSSHIRPFGVLPWCFADPRNCRTDNRFPDPFLPDPKTFAGKDWDNQGGREELEERVGQVWSLHLHNQWNKAFPNDGWVQRLLNGYTGQLERLEIYAQAKGLVGSDGRIRLDSGE